MTPDGEGDPGSGGPRIDVDLLRTQPARRGHLTREGQEALAGLSRLSERSGRLSPLTYNVTISHGHRFVWYRVAKVATRSILGYFEEHDIALDVARARRIRVPTGLLGGYAKFAFVRDPLERFVSAWQDKVVGSNYFGFDERTLAAMQTIEAFAEWTGSRDLADLRDADHHLALQSRLVDLTQVDHLGRLETFDRDFARILGVLGLPARDVRVRNAAGGDRADALARPGLRATVAELYRRDYEIFGYPSP